MLLTRGDFYEKKWIFNFSKVKEFSQCTDTNAGISRYNGVIVCIR